MQMAQKKLAIIASRGTLDWAYPPLILASTAAALGYEVRIFFTFYGVKLLEKKLDLRVTSIGNPAMPMPLSLPVMVQALPGMEALMTYKMKAKMKQNGVVSIEELRDLCIEAEVKMIACQMTVDLFGFKRANLIEEAKPGGAATFFEFAGKSDVNLFM